jgi:3-phenylpropionate/cinnamic acid dioxygenase small subunit
VTTASRLLEADATAFINHEADLADKHQYAAWLALWNPERALYYVPMVWDQPERRHLAVIRDNHARLSDRIRRLLSGKAHLQDPPSSLCRVVSVLDVAEGPENGTIATRSKFVLVEVRPDRQGVWAGEVLHVLGRRDDDSSLEIWSKEIRLVNMAQPLQSLGFII